MSKQKSTSKQLIIFMLAMIAAAIKYVVLEVYFK